jgi:proteasome lid subunit RPN8/RPN11
MLRLRSEDLERIRRHAEEEYPRECCGVLTAAGAEVLCRPHPCRSLQDRIHAAEPDRHPRDARSAFYLDPRDLVRFLSAAETGGSRIAGLYHSHIDCDAYFSAEDLQGALFDRQPAYPEAVHLVLSVRRRRLVGQRCFAWDEERGGFVEVGLEVVGPA